MKYVISYLSMSKKGWKATEKQLAALSKGREAARVSVAGNKSKSERMKGENNRNYRRDFSPEHRERLSRAGKGRSPFNKGLAWEAWMSPEGQEKVLKNLDREGIEHWNWKGGIQKERRPRVTTEYKRWRMAVFQRDGFTCVSCSKTSNELKKDGIRIIADHIKSWVDYTESRFNVDNGRTLCEPCHYLTDNFGFKIMWSRIKNADNNKSHAK